MNSFYDLLLLFADNINSSYKYFYLRDKWHFTMYSYLVGNCFSTSFFNLRNKTGRKTVYNLAIISGLF